MAFFDLDGTLLNKQSQLDEEVIQALHHIRDNGILPVIATGRGHFELDNLMAQSGITSAVAMRKPINSSSLEGLTPRLIGCSSKN